MGQTYPLKATPVISSKLIPLALSVPSASLESSRLRTPAAGEVSQVPAPSAVAGALHPRAAAGDRLREALLARVQPATASVWAAQDAELDAEIAARGFDPPVPTVEELEGSAPDPYAGPPEGAWGWLADLPGPLREEYLDATAEPRGAKPPTGAWDRVTDKCCGFAAGGAADELAPGPVLAGLAGDMAAAGLGRCSDDELIGVLRAGRRLASWSVSLELSAAGELMSRRAAQEAAGQSQAAEHADAEIAAALTLTGRAAGRLIDQALAMQRLPLTACALAAGAIDMPRAMVIADEVSGLDDAQAAAVEERVLVRAAGQTTSQLRAAARRAVLAADPAAADRRQEQAQRDARVERWAEHAGTAALAGRDLPPAGVLAADQHLSELARWLRAAGLTGTMDQLRAQAFLALLAGQPVTSLLPAGADPAEEPGIRSSGGIRGDPGPPLTGNINMTVPLRTWLGFSDSPGEVAGFGPLSASDCRRLGEGMAASPRTRWCLTVTDGHGRPIAHGCTRPGRGLPGPPGEDTGAWVAGIPLQWLETDGCAHRRESTCYRPPVSLQHLIRIRQQRCAFPGCGRPARRCDLDHTVPYHRGGRTCECNLAPLCRRHHEAKQAPGWHLEQLRPGILTWTTPSGRRCTTCPSTYAE